MEIAELIEQLQELVSSGEAAPDDDVEIHTPEMMRNFSSIKGIDTEEFGVRKRVIIYITIKT